MTTPTRIRSTLSDDVDPALSAEYRRVADESVPDALDRAVLHASRNEAGRSPKNSRFAGWLRPAALAATVALSLALILEMNESRLGSTSFPDDRPASRTEQSDRFREAGSSAAEQLRQAEIAAAGGSQNSPSKTTPAMDTTVTTDRSLSLLPDEAFCNEQQRSTMTRWWQCIQSLESRGATSAAERELAGLMKTFPGFAQPGN